MRRTRFALSGLLGTLASGLCLIGVSPAARGSATPYEPRLVHTCPCPPIARLAVAAGERIVRETCAQVSPRALGGAPANFVERYESGGCLGYGGTSGCWGLGGDQSPWLDYGFDPMPVTSVGTDSPSGSQCEPLDAPQVERLAARKPSEVEVLEAWYSPRLSERNFTAAQEAAELTLRAPRHAAEEPQDACPLQWDAYGDGYSHDVSEAPSAWRVPDCFTDCRESDLPAAVADEQHSVGQADAMRINAQNDGLDVATPPAAMEATADAWDADAWDAAATRRQATLPGCEKYQTNDREPCELKDCEYGDSQRNGNNDDAAGDAEVDADMFQDEQVEAEINHCPGFPCPFYRPMPGDSARSKGARGGDAYDADGYDATGYDREGFDREGYDALGYDCGGYNRFGFDAEGFDACGFDCEGYDRRGIDTAGRDRNGYCGSEFSPSDYPCGEHLPKYSSSQCMPTPAGDGEEVAYEPHDAEDACLVEEVPKSRIVATTVNFCGRIGRAIGEVNQQISGAADAGAVWLTPSADSSSAPDFSAPAEGATTVEKSSQKARSRQTYSPVDLNGPHYRTPSFMIPSVFELGL